MNQSQCQRIDNLIIVPNFSVGLLKLFLSLTLRIDVSITASHDAIGSARLFLERSVSGFVAERERAIVVDFVVVADGLDWCCLCLWLLGARCECLHLSSSEWSHSGHSWSVLALSHSGLLLLSVQVLVFLFVDVHEFLGIVLLGLRCWSIILHDLTARLFFRTLDRLLNALTDSNSSRLSFRSNGE